VYKLDGIDSEGSGVANSHRGILKAPRYAYRSLSLLNVPQIQITTKSIERHLDSGFIFAKKPF